MATLDGHRFGRWSLRLDAIYCATLGLAVAIWAPQIAREVLLPERVLTLAGVAVVLWAGLLLGMLSRMPLRRALIAVMLVNLLAAGLVAACAFAGGSVLAVAAVLAIAVDVALFAGSQAVALRYLPQRLQSGAGPALPGVTGAEWRG